MKNFYKLYSTLDPVSDTRVWASVDLLALRKNYRTLRSFLKTRLIAVVKADAYGHGAPACVRALLEEGCDFFAVSSLEEAIAVREVCIEVQKQAQILILGYTDVRFAQELADFGLIQTLLSYD